MKKYPVLTPLTLEAARKFLKTQKIPHHANDNISSIMTPELMVAMETNIETLFRSILETLLIDVETDHNCRDTPRRFAKMLVRETMSGRFNPPPAMTSFPNVKNLDELIVEGPITVESMCSHHMQNIRGECYIGILPTPESRLPGLSKYSRVVDWLCRRPQIQEELTTQIADYLEEAIGTTAGLGVVVIAEHQCMSVRGVKEHAAVTTTSVLRGEMRNHALKSEFMEFLNINKRHSRS